ncbi:hypothetical protein V4C85_15285 [Ralstonia solanacearum]|nr:hypothetical protein [Ralstonia solanacearum]MDB0508091.1 hypothetical protein [Ralstonia solanacearum]MDB0512360.1 hypothetical protein [Ralstonia solanacearum]MDB0529540.1 hypothetical protein [Ralstonia solanacearum]MDB0568269.1 hypothetical protein [Ralstonia solanacearum]MDB0576754.1 hypothetical protein [Ralstonia solanacearum]
MAELESLGPDPSALTLDASCTASYITRESRLGFFFDGTKVHSEWQ